MLNSSRCRLTPLAVRLEGEESEITVSARFLSPFEVKIIHYALLVLLL